MTDMKIPPYDGDAEEAFLGSIIIDGDMIEDTILTENDFFLNQHRHIFRAMMSLHEKNVGINQITLARQLDEDGVLEDCGGAAHLSHLVYITPSSIDCVHYAGVVKRLSSYRQIIDVAARLEKYGYDGKMDISSLLSTADELILSLRQNSAEANYITPEQREKMMTERYMKLYEKEEGAALKTGLKDLDWALGGGLFAGDLVIIAGRPGMGKTALLETITNNISMDNNVLFCSGEMSVEALSDRDVAGLVGKSVSAIRRGGYDDELMDMILDKAIPNITGRRIFHLDDRHNLSLTSNNIYQTALQVKMRHGLSLVIIDYLGLLTDTGNRNDSETIRIGRITRNLKRSAKVLGVPILIAHQLSRKVEERDDKHPRLDDLRDSGNIEQDADIVLFPYRASYYFTEAKWKQKYPGKEYPASITEIGFGKFRQSGKTAGKFINLYWDDAHQKYQNLAREEKKEPDGVQAKAKL